MDKGNKKPEYITVGELSVGFSENIIELTDNLVGRQIMLNYEFGKKARITCADTEVLKWETEDQGREEKFICSYRAIMPRKDIYFVDFIVSYGDSRSVSVILDLERNIATVVTGIMPTAEEVMIPLIIRAEKKMPLTSVQAIFEHAAIGGPFSETTPRHEKTTDLVGERFQWVYSSKDAYEHIYLNEQTYTWQCLAGSEKGLADTDRCFFYKLGRQLYLFVWIEKIIPTVGVVLEDLEAMRSYGKIFGHESYDVNGRIKNFAVGSYGKWLNRTQYDFSRIEK
ncbi:MAG TPA: molybdenum cofactor biosynthesis F family protein [Thermodesulfobacteriota bacterium]|nr:molybdenum cofactor biosynthesis F family protein [Thermodesulfobacteriota bacterium]